MNRVILTAGVATALLSLAGCGAFRRQPDTAAARISTEELLSALPAERKQEVTAAETNVREAERRAERAKEAVSLAEDRLRAARAEVDAQRARVERARAQADLVRSQHQAQLRGAPAAGQAPADTQTAARRLAEAEHAVDVARWRQDQAQETTTLRERELAYAKAFQEAAQREIEVQRAQLGLARAEVVTRSTPGVVEGVVDPRVSSAQADLREAQAEYARAHADATRRLADMQIQRRVMTRFAQGPPPLSPSASGMGRSGAELAPAARPVELAPLPWPDAWQPDAPQEGSVTPGSVSGTGEPGRTSGMFEPLAPAVPAAGREPGAASGGPPPPR